MADPVPANTVPQTNALGMKNIGSEGWSPLDLLPVSYVWNAAVGAMTPKYDVPATAGQNQFQATVAPTPQYDFLNTVGSAEMAQQQAREQQAALNEAILARARGEGPSIAEMQLRQATDRLQGQQAGMIASQRGMDPSLQRRLIMTQAANAQQQMNAQGALLRAQEQQAAQALAAQSLGQMRGQDQGMFGQGASANQGQAGLASANFNAAQGINANVAGQNATADWMRFEAERQKAVAAANANAGMLNAVAGGISAAAGAPGAGGGMSNPAGTGVIGDPNYDKYFNSNMPMSGESLDQYDKYFEPPKMAGGGMVPGYAEGGDNPKNDTVPAWLSPQEVVLPRSVTLAPDAPQKAAEFMAMMQARPQAKRASPAMLMMRGGK